MFFKVFITPYVVSKTDLMVYQFQTFDTKIICTSLFFVEKDISLMQKQSMGTP